MQLDPDQNKAVTIDETCVVSAGAGSGKTSVLSERFLRLIVEEKTSVDRILTLTFTRKAAAEMRERIYHKLCAGNGGAARAAVENFDTASISTLDSFCARIVRSEALRLGIPREFVTDEEAQQELVAQTAYDFLAANRHNPVFVDYLADWGLARTLEDVFVAIGTRYGTPGVDQDLEALFEAQETETLQRTNAYLHELRTVLLSILEIEGEKPNALANAKKAVSTLAEPVGVIDPDRLEDIGHLVEVVASFSLQVGGSKKTEALLAYKELVERARDLGRLVDAGLEMLRRRSETAIFFSAILEYLEAVKSAKRRSGILDYADVAELSIHALKANPLLLDHYRKRFDAVMIDEFQDNNALQKELLYLLSSVPGTGASPGPGELARGKLFFVGDAKQSIYRFRGADVSVFRGLARELAIGDGTALELRYNYRSSPAIISTVNTVFERVFAEAHKPYEAEHGALLSGVESTIKPHIELWLKGASEDEFLSPAEAEAYHVAYRIRELVDGHELLIRDEGKTRPASFDDIAILFRKSSVQRFLEPMLRRFAVPYQTEATRNLLLEASTNDFFAILQLLVYPHDRAAYAALLRSPFVGLSDAGFVSALRPQENGAFAPFVLHPEEVLSDKDAERFAFGHILFADLVARVDVETPATLVSRLWYDYGYRYFLLENPRHHAYLEHFDFLYEFALAAEGKALVDFLAVLRPKLGKPEQLDGVEPMRRRSGGVRLMTIHKAKGLEFPVVFLVDAGSTTRPRSGGPLLFSARWGPVPSVRRHNKSPLPRAGKSVNLLFEEAKDVEAAEETAESKRLLYVACTRAKDHLFVTASHKSDEPAEGSHYKLFESAVLEGNLSDTVTLRALDDVPESAIIQSGSDQISVDMAQVVERYQNLPTPRVEAGVPEVAVTTLAASYNAMRWAPRWAAEEAGPDQAGDGGTPQASGNPGIAGGHGPGAGDKTAGALDIEDLLTTMGLENYFGTLCHRLIEHRLRTGNFSAFVDPPVDRLDLAPDTVARLVHTARELAQTLFSRAEMQALVAPENPAEHDGAAKTVESEVPFLMRFADKALVRGTIDLLVTQKDRSIVVDFKTDKHEAPEHHAAQLAFYRLAARSLAGHDVVTYLAYVRSGRIVEVLDEGTEALCDAAVAAFQAGPERGPGSGTESLVDGVPKGGR